MRVPKYPYLVVSNPDWERVLQTHEAARQIYFEDLENLLQGNLHLAADSAQGGLPNVQTEVIDVVFDTGTNKVVNHGLQREPLGFAVVKALGGSIINAYNLGSTSAVGRGFTVTSGSQTVNLTGGGWTMSATNHTGGFFYPTGSANSPTEVFKITSVLSTTSFTIDRNWPTANETDIAGVVEYAWTDTQFSVVAINQYSWARLLVF